MENDLILITGKECYIKNIINNYNPRCPNVIPDNSVNSSVLSPQIENIRRQRLSYA
ncbi:hypothetical protein MTR_6g034675 [Medicago truncatula]|uniref:Uncharacterized protein n=1 Tax=Medicago truncatula TaxID=3880 RepID=A0A072U7R8_MEDTR|nr:hypothetical protein MTR_6g034675 [Medicago truncatula]